MTKKPDSCAELATLQNVLDGKISGRISEWPQLRPAIAWAVEQLTQPIASSEAAQGEQDATRYRWLRDNLPSGTLGDFDVFDSASWDAAIDAAIQSEGPQTDSTASTREPQA